MAHYAELDSNNIVLQVIVVRNEDCLDENGQESETAGINYLKSIFGENRTWLKTSYNTRANVYYTGYNPDVISEDQSKALRKNYAGIGFSYNAEFDAFIEPKPYPSWILNTNKFVYEPPIPRPSDHMQPDYVNNIIKFYNWDENSVSWTFESTTIPDWYPGNNQ